MCELFQIMRKMQVAYCFVLYATFVGSTEILDSFKPDQGDDDFEVIRLTDRYGNLTRTIIIPKVKPPVTTIAPPATTTRRIPTKMHYQPPSSPSPDDDDQFVLVSHSSYPNRLGPSGFHDGSSDKPEVLSQPTGYVPPQVPGHVPPNKKIRRRRRRKKPVRTPQHLQAHEDMTGAATDQSALKNHKCEKMHNNKHMDPYTQAVLNLFTIVRFPNDECADGGTCYTDAECANLGGTAGMPCAKGYGVCCMLTSRCGTTGEINGRVFRGLGEAGVCSLTINKSPCAKQIRLDFINLELEPPNDGECGPERLLIAGQNRNSPVPVLCGSNSGQHVYLDVDETGGPIMVSVVSNDPQDFKIKVTQICDGSRLQAPKHCLQYYLEEEGIVESFNYLPQSGRSSGYLNNLDYAICIRKGAGMCSIMYKNEANGVELPFDINNIDTDGGPTVPEGEAGAEVFNCPDDFIAVRNVRLCGQKVNDASSQPDFTRNAPVIDSSTGPFIVSFVTDRAISGLGFRLKYKQIPC